jgi:hypothetical protein
MSFYFLTEFFRYFFRVSSGGLKVVFCSTLPEFENFDKCQLVKTKRQANFKDFKRFGAFNGLVEQNFVFNSFVCKLGTRRPTHAKQSPIYTQIC